MSGFTDNYIRIDAPLQETLLNTVATVNLNQVNDKGQVEAALLQLPV